VLKHNSVYIIFQTTKIFSFIPEQQQQQQQQQQQAFKGHFPGQPR